VFARSATRETFPPIRPFSQFRDPSLALLSTQLTHSVIRPEPTNGLMSHVPQADIRGDTMRAVKMVERDHAFTTIELLAVLATLGVIAAMAVPSVVNSVRGYRLHSDLSTLASLCNVARLRAASQYAPYRVNVSVAAGTYSIEKLCGNTASSVDAACTSAYAAFTTPQIESGTQYVLQGDTFTSCRPSGPTSYPGTITADAVGCPDPVHLYFNTRGTPVDNAGNPLANGGVGVYMTNQNGMVDALTLSIGGQAAVWNWDPSASKWYSR